jgi:hypothetical protein
VLALVQVLGAVGLIVVNQQIGVQKRPNNVFTRIV